MKKLKLVFIFILINISLNGQSYINVQGHFNYWKHTDVFGPGIGLGYSHKFSKLVLTLNYDYGYGTVHRFNSLDNIDYNNWSTVFIKDKNTKWFEYLGYTGTFSTDLEGKSDYGKQHQISVDIGYPIYQKGNKELIVSSGVFLASVEHFYTYTNIPIHYIDLSPWYRGPLNYIPATSQKIATFGANFRLGLNITKGSRIFTPFTTIGVGPRYSSYASIGVQMSTRLKLKK